MLLSSSAQGSARRRPFLFVLVALAFAGAACSSHEAGGDDGGIGVGGADADLCASSCDDDDPCTRDSCDESGACQNEFDEMLCFCPELDGNCLPVESAAAVEHHMAELESCSFGLQRFDDDNDALLDELAGVAGGFLTIEDVLADLNREASTGIGATNANRLTNHNTLGFRWNSGDQATLAWYPQGITGGSDAQDDGRPFGRRVVMVSWYDHTGVRPSKGVRVSLADLTNTGDVRYRHLLLAVPEGEPGSASFAASNYASGGPLHAGGIAWIGDLLYVAVSGRGFWVYDLSRILKMNAFDGKTRIGRSGDTLEAHGYKYIVPRIAGFTTPSDACKAVFSFAGLDRSGEQPVIVSGEYHKSDALGRLISWPIDLSTGWLIPDGGGHVRAHSAVVAAQSRMQGALTYEGNYYISSSSQTSTSPNFGRLYRTRPGRESSISAWIYGAEDLYMERDTNRIWTAGEHPSYRDTVSIIRLDP